jgi:putative ABC transport system ATP-binding protein
VDNHALAVQVKGVSKTFSKGKDAVHALKRVNFDTRIGELQMLVGPSGCGKTTLLSVIAGTLSFDEGEIEVFGTALKSLSEQQVTEFRKRNVGFIFQQYNLIPTLTNGENVAIPLLLNGMPYAEALVLAKKMFVKVGMEGRDADFPKMLSGGQQQRVAIARALIHEPRLVICDEPTAALDADSGAKIMELMVEVARSPGRSVIVVTHDNRIFKFADRLARMDDGAVLSMEENRK